MAGQRVLPSILAQQQKQQEQRHRDSDEPEKNGHVCSFQVWLVRKRSDFVPQVPSRKPPPSVAASEAENAPMISAAVNQSASCAAFLRALSRSDLTWLVTSVTRFSASACGRPVRAATTLAT